VSSGLPRPHLREEGHDKAQRWGGAKSSRQEIKRTGHGRRDAGDVRNKAGSHVERGEKGHPIKKGKSSCRRRNDEKRELKRRINSIQAEGGDGGGGSESRLERENLLTWFGCATKENELSRERREKQRERLILQRGLGKSDKMHVQREVPKDGRVNIGEAL